MSEYHDSESSDDDVCFGEYTIKEAKKDLLKCMPRKINYRHSSISKFRETEIDTTEDISSLANNCEEESMSTDRLSQNTEFLEKLTKVIDEPVSEASSYNTAFDRTNTFENACDQSDNTFLKRIGQQPSFALDNTHLTLVGNTVVPSEESFNSCDYDHKSNDYCNPEESICDSVITISDESFELQNVSRSPGFDTHSNTFPRGQVIDHTNSLYEHSTDNKVSKTSSDFKNLSISDSDTEPKNDSCHIQLRDSPDNLSDNQESSENTSFEHLQRFERVIIDCNQLSKISEKTEFTTCIDGGSSINQQDDSSGASLKDNRSNPGKSRCSDSQREDIQESKKSTPDIHLNSSSDVSKISSISGVSNLSKNLNVDEDLDGIEYLEASAQSSEAYQLDDTFEEINRLLEQGVDYEMPEIHPLRREPFSSDNIISGSFMNTSLTNAGLENKTHKPKMLSVKSAEKCKVFYSAEKITKPSVKRGEGLITTVKPRSKQELTSIFSSKSPRTPFVKKTEVEGAFKIPSKPVKKLPTPSKLPKPLNTIVSPVGVYIKHSPKYCPMRRVPSNPVNAHTKMSKLVKPHSTSVKENIPGESNQEIPKVIYRPAKHREVTEEKRVLLPGSIKKLINEQVVTKHEQRIQDDECNQSIERRLMESDLSLNLSHNSQNISILTNKQPFNIGRF